MHAFHKLVAHASFFCITNEHVVRLTALCTPIFFFILPETHCLVSSRCRCGGSDKKLSDCFPHHAQSVTILTENKKKVLEHALLTFDAHRLVTFASVLFSSRVYVFIRGIHAAVYMLLAVVAFVVVKHKMENLAHLSFSFSSWRTEWRRHLHFLLPSVFFWRWKAPTVPVALAPVVMLPASFFVLFLYRLFFFSSLVSGVLWR